MSPKVYEAKWVYARAKAPPVVENGEVVFPQQDLRLGCYVDERYVSEGDIKCFQKPDSEGRTPVARFLDETDGALDAAQVSNAFKSVRHRIGGSGELAVVELSIRSESKETALAVSTWWSRGLPAMLERENAERLEKHSRHVREYCACLQRKYGVSCDPSERLRQVEKQSEEFDRRLYTVKPPYICNE